MTGGIMPSMDESKNILQEMIPEPALRRLPWYLAYLKMLDKQHVARVSSTQIAQKINVDASQVAKDLSFLNIRGKTRVGYEVRQLVRSLSDFLGFKHRHNAFIIGTGSLGTALMADSGLEQYGLHIVAGFDVDPQVVGTSIAGIPVYDISELRARQRESSVAIAVLAVPVENAQEVTDTIVKCNFKAIWNFTPFRIKVPADVVIQNTSIYAHLAVMYNRLDVARARAAQAKKAKTPSTEQ